MTPLYKLTKEADADLGGSVINQRIPLESEDIGVVIEK